MSKINALLLIFGFLLAAVASAQETPRISGESRSGKEDDQIQRLLLELKANDFSKRLAAEKALKTIGKSAAEPLLQLYLSPDSSLESRTRCLNVLRYWSRSSDAGLRKHIVSLLQKATGKKNAPENLKPIREMFFLDIANDPKLAIEKLAAGGFVIQEYGNGYRISATVWHGKPREIQYLQAIKNPVHLNASPALLLQLIDVLPKTSTVALRVVRSNQGGPMEFRKRRAPPEELPDDLMRQVSRIPKLKELALSWTKLSRKGFESIGECINLEKLILPSTTTDEDLKAVGKLKNLQELRFHNAFQIKGDGFQHLGKLEHLEHLEIFFTNATGDSLKHLTKLPSLKKLYASQSFMDDVGMTHVARMKKLTWLKLDNTQVTQFGLAHIRNHPTLKELELSSGSLSDSGILKLNSMPSLTSIRVSASVITDAVKEFVKENGETVVVSGQFYKPNSKAEYAAIEKLLSSGVQIAQYPRPANLSVSIIPQEWKGSYKTIREFANLKLTKTVYLFLYGDIPAKLVDEILQLPSTTRIMVMANRRYQDDGIAPAQMQRLREHFDNLQSR